MYTYRGSSPNGHSRRWTALYLRPLLQNPVFLNSFDFPVSGHLQLRTPFSCPKGVCLRELPLYIHCFQPNCLKLNNSLILFFELQCINYYLSLAEGQTLLVMLSLPKAWDIQEKFIHFVEVRIFYMRKYRNIIYNFKLDGICFLYISFSGYHLTISSCVSMRMSRYWACGKFGEHERGAPSATLASWVLSKLPACSISRHTHSCSMN